MSLSYVVVLLAVAVAFGIRTSLHLRQQKSALLADATPMIPDANTVVYVSVLTLGENLDADKGIVTDRVDQSTVKDLVDLVNHNGGSVGYLGRCWLALYSSQQFPSQNCDLVVTTIWEKHNNRFEQFRTMTMAANNTAGWSVHQAQQMVVHPATSVLGAVVIHGILPLITKTYSLLTGFEYPLDEQVDPTATGTATDDEHVVPAQELLQTRDIMMGNNNEEAIAAADKEPVFIWSFMQLETLSPKDDKANKKYMSTHIVFLARYGGGPLHLGSLRPANANQDGTFQELAAAYYPSRAFLAKTVASKWMYKVAQDKRGGQDSFVAVTVPYKL